jgi:acetyl-CoA acetyltransferase
LTGVAIAGVAESDLGETGRSALDLASQAVLRALDDCGLTLRDVDGLATNGIGRFPTTHLAEHLGLRPRWVESTFAGGSTFLSFIGRAVEAIAAGDATTVVIAYGSDQRSARRRTLTGPVDESVPEGRLEAPYAPLYPASFYAMAAQRYLHDHGATMEQLAHVAVSAREWALRNPKAFRYDAGPLTVDDVLASPLVSTPLRAADCCLVTDGGGALVVTSRARAKDLKRKPVEVAGYGEATTHNSMSQAPTLDGAGATASSLRAFGMAAMELADVDVLQVYDSFTVTPVLTLEAIGFAARGEGAALAATGALGPGGMLPTNTTGGGLSYCHPGQLGVLLAVEAVRQLRGECGERQVPGAEVALCHGTGGILSHHSTVLLRKAR